ncbi:MAG: 3-dehydroquinate synthase, 3-dehydroquinate synthase [Candidatus Peregrinibacteria bacterium GW2011_GWF2_43_17]|nr:MAG: 3-dehydroquinate synthase, 3-dehydroquinate synthase [Candidatus Peregrinibacteria bacterium GW2011_GWF2_43_17]KKT20341.1 MAG: 3-dehydroquinate synthase [Candidatus Peregrinibacteria bacterium GW2011_GWA2_43_8]HAU39404.1 3-dehydroquinate synthase [Candidatus Peregrinibacteria bacterium]
MTTHIENLASTLKKLPYNRYCVITDKNVYKHYGKFLHKFDLIIKEPGEKLKTLANIEKTAKKLIKLGLDRGSCLIAVGGGVIGDFTGFLASIYMRGIPYIQVPTTLLAMVDSSVGGKTGVNLSLGKNLLGTFYQPVLTLSYPETLQTLSLKELKNGIAESIKHACIGDKSLFGFLEKNHEKILAKDPATLNKLITQSSAIKLKITGKDEHEKGVRMFLNYGHTIGHAIEQASNYELSHGEAISIGIHQVNLFSKSPETKRIENLLKLYDLPTKIPSNLKKQEIAKIIKTDKKKFKGKLRFVTVRKIGSATII